MGIRQKLAAEPGSQPGTNELLGRQAPDDVLVHRPVYKPELSKFRICGVFPGDGWSGSMNRQDSECMCPCHY